MRAGGKKKAKIFSRQKFPAIHVWLARRYNFLTNNSPQGSNFTQRRGASCPCRVYVFAESAISTTLMVNSADPAARWVWPTLTSRHVTGAVNLIKMPSHNPWKKVSCAYMYKSWSNLSSISIIYCKATFLCTWQIYANSSKGASW